MRNATQSTITESTGYRALFGNMFEAMEFDNEEPLKIWWLRMVTMSRSKGFGDVDLFYNGKLIRSVWNAERRILDKECQYPVKYLKYN